MKILNKLWNVVSTKHKWTRYKYRDSSREPMYYFHCPNCKSNKMYKRESLWDWHKIIYRCMKCCHQYIETKSEMHPLSYRGL